MTTATESASNLFEATFNNLRQAAGSAVQLQQEMYKEWAKLWPGLAQSTVDWNANFQKSQKEWVTRITGAMRKHLELVDQQYRAGIESLEAAAASSDSMPARYCWSTNSRCFRMAPVILVAHSFCDFWKLAFQSTVDCASPGHSLAHSLYISSCSCTADPAAWRRLLKVASKRLEADSVAVVMLAPCQKRGVRNPKSV